MNGKETRFWLFLCVLWMVACVVILGMVNEAKAADPPAKWLIIGDGTASAVVEYNVVPPSTAAWPYLVGNLANIQPVLLPTGASSYVYFPAGAKLVVESIPAYGAAGVILVLGSNDFGTGQNIGAVQYAAYQLVQRIKALGVSKVVCVTPIRRWDDKTRRGPNPGQVSALGYTLVPVPLVTRATYSSAIANGCASAGAGVVLGYTAPLVLGFTHYTPAVQGTTMFQYLNQAGHQAFAQWFAALMKVRGYWQ